MATKLTPEERLKKIYKNTNDWRNKNYKTFAVAVKNEEAAEWVALAEELEMKPATMIKEVMRQFVEEKKAEKSGAEEEESRVE